MIVSVIIFLIIDYGLFGLLLISNIDQSTTPDHYGKIFYKVEQETAEGKYIFTEVVSYEPMFPEILSTGEFTDEQEMIELSEAFLDYRHGGLIKKWNLVEVKYYLYDCKKGLNGYTHAAYYYERSNWDGSQYYVEGYLIDLLPVEGIVISERYDYSREELDKNSRSIVWENINVNATKALEIIGDKESNDIQNVQDNPYCEIIMQLSDGRKLDWNIWYAGQNGPFYKATVDEQKGKVKVVN